MSAPRVLILGGGFGGVYTALRLEKILRAGEAEITPADRIDRMARLQDADPASNSRVMRK